MSALEAGPVASVATPAPPQFQPPPQRWQLNIPHVQQAADLAADAHLPLVIAELLLARGIDSAETARDFLNPAINQLSDPFLMLGMDAAVARIELALARGETILLYGDYDVDGTTAVVLLKTALEMLRVADPTVKELNYQDVVALRYLP